MGKKEKLNIFAWSISTFATTLAITAWGQAFKWDIAGLSIYGWFPLFGLIAFSLMWAHYVIAAVRMKMGLEASATSVYFEGTSLIVLLAILLHPSLLIWQLWRDGFGLPPNSYLTFVGQNLRWVVTLGSISLAIFLVYELRRQFGKRGWWKYIQYASDAAMVAIFYHGLRLGHNTQAGWFHDIWLIYGITLAIALLVIYTNNPTKNKKTAG